MTGLLRILTLSMLLASCSVAATVLFSTDGTAKPAFLSEDRAYQSSRSGSSTVEVGMSFTVGQSALVGSLVAPLYTAVSPYTASFRIVELTDYRFGAVAGTFVPQSVYQIGVLPSLYYTFVPVGTIALEQGREYVLVLDPPEQTSAAPALVNWLRAEVDRNATVYFREGSAYGVSADPRAAFALLAAGGPEPGNVPEPGTLALIPAGLLLICWRSRLR